MSFSEEEKSALQRPALAQKPPSKLHTLCMFVAWKKNWRMMMDYWLLKH